MYVFIMSLFGERQSLSTRSFTLGRCCSLFVVDGLSKGDSFSKYSIVRSNLNVKQLNYTIFFIESPAKELDFNFQLRYYYVLTLTHFCKVHVVFSQEI